MSRRGLREWTLAVGFLALLPSWARAADPGYVFAPPVFRYGTLGQPTALSAVDVTGDGVTDLVALLTDYSGIATLGGVGNGVFRLPALLPTVAAPTEMWVGDLTGDARVDVVTMAGGTGTIGVHVGTGLDVGVLGTTLEAGTGAQSLAVGDATADGCPDVLVLMPALFELRIYPGRCDGTFGAPLTLPTGVAPAAEVVADVTGDGIPDVLVANAGSAYTSAFIGQGDGTFVSQRDTIPGFPVRHLVAEDIDHNGTMDVVAGLTTCINAGGGVFSCSSGPDAAVSATGDLSGDGLPDYVGPEDGLFGSIWLRTSATDYESAPPCDPRTMGTAHVLFGDYASALVIADLTGDGRADLAVAGGRAINVIPGRADSIVCNGSTLIFGRTGAGSDVRAGDYDGDGSIDLVAVTRSSLTVYWGMQRDVTTTLTGGGDWIVPADVDGDGLLDVCTGGSDWSEVSIARNFGGREFGWLPSVGISWNGHTPCGGSDAAFGDLNADGYLDLVIAIDYCGSVDVRLGDGDGTFADATRYPVGWRPTMVAVADMNGDGLLDVVSVVSDELAIRLGAGDGTLGTLSLFRGPSYTTRGAVADVDGNGSQDVITTFPTGVSVFLNDGTGSFADRCDYQTGGDPWRVTTGDLDGDGNLDVIVGSRSSGGLAILRGRGDGTFEPRREVSGGWAASQILVGEFSGDDRPDVLVAHASSGLATLLTNYSPSDPPPGSQPTPPEWDLAQACSSLAIPPPPPPIVGNASMAVHPTITDGTNPARVSFRTQGIGPGWVRVLDVRGHVVQMLAAFPDFAEGDHEYTWDTFTMNGARAPNGVYVIDAEAPGMRAQRRVIVLR